MPNHYLTVGLCSWDRRALDMAGKEPYEVDLSPLESANLCELVLPLPDALRGIVAAYPRRHRAVHRKTGEVHPTGEVDGDREQWQMVNLENEELARLQEKCGACDWHEWQVDNWGTKWGTYQTRVHRLGGDGSPILIEFQSAWGPPCGRVMRLIEQYLSERFHLSNFTWVGHNPGNGKTGMVAPLQREAEL